MLPKLIPALSQYLEVLISLARWPLVWAVLAFGIALLYRFGPGKNVDIAWRWISWERDCRVARLIASMAFSWYAANFGTFNKTYGLLGAGIGFMTWIWISAIVILIGEEVNEIIDAAKKPAKEQGKANPLGVPGKASCRHG